MVTLRATIEIVPFGNEGEKRELYRLDISNLGVVRDEGFGHQICRYKVNVFGRVLDYFKPEVGKEWEHIDTDFIEEHDRRDGAVALVALATELVKERM